MLCRKAASTLGSIALLVLDRAMLPEAAHWLRPGDMGIEEEAIAKPLRIKLLLISDFYFDIFSGRCLLFKVPNPTPPPLR